MLLCGWILLGEQAPPSQGRSQLGGWGDPWQSWRRTMVGRRQGRGLSWVVMVPHLAALPIPPMSLSCLAPKSQWWQPHAVGDTGKRCVTWALVPPSPPPAPCTAPILLQGSHSSTPSIPSASTETSLHPTPSVLYSLSCAMRDKRGGLSRADCCKTYTPRSLLASASQPSQTGQHLSSPLR